MMAGILAASLILNMVWVGLVAGRASMVGLIAGVAVAAIHVALLANTLWDVVEAPMAVDAATLAWHGCVLPATIGAILLLRARRWWSARGGG